MGVSCMKTKIVSKSSESSQLYKQISHKKGPTLKLEEISVSKYYSSPAKSPEDQKTIIKVLNSHFIFSSLSEEDKETIAEAMQLCYFPSGSIIFKQGTPSKSFYIIKSGSVEVLVNDHKVNKLLPGSGFGELALIGSFEHSTTIRCLESTILFVIERRVFKKILEELSTQSYEQSRMFLDKIQILSSLTPSQKDDLSANMFCVKFSPGQTIVQEGEEGNIMYIVKQGIVKVLRKGQEINQLFSGSIFGEQALITNTVRNATCIASDTVLCICLSREVIQQVLKYELKEVIQRNYIVEALNRSPVLGLLKNSQKDAIARDLRIVEYFTGDIIINKGELCSNKLYIIVSGKIQNSRSIHLFEEKGFCIGDEFIGDNNSNKYEDDFIAGCDMQVGEITKYQLELTLGGKYKEVISENSAISVFRKVWLFNELDDEKLKKVIKRIKLEKFLKGTIVLKEGKKIGRVFIVKRGKIDVFDNGKAVRVISKYGFFGESGLLGLKVVNKQYVAGEESTVWTINLEDFREFVSDNMVNQLELRLIQYNTDIGINDLLPIQVLGKGLYSKVYLVYLVKRYFALKTYEYRTIKKLFINQQILNERQVLMTIDHPFIVRYIKSFKDRNRIYFLLEFIQGITLEKLMQNIGIFTIKDSKFYLACIIIVVQYLHELNILHRDLNPENIIIDQTGYIKLIDFNSAKTVTSKSYTMVTCPYYLAPEVICGKGYTKQSEVWNLGILFYEFICGKVPFGQTQDDPLCIYEEILKTDLSFPSDIPYISEAAKSLIEVLLQKHPENRHSGSVEKLKFNPFFVGFDWDELSRKKAMPPFKSEDLDMTNSIRSNSLIDLDFNEFIEHLSDSDESLPPIDDDEINLYSSQIPENWDQVFN